MPKTPAEREHDLADELLSVSELAKDVQRLALEQAHAEATQHKLKDAAGTARNASVTVGISIEKRALLLDKPTAILERRDAGDILRRLGAKVPGLVVEGTVEEIPLTVSTMFHRPDPARGE